MNLGFRGWGQGFRDCGYGLGLGFRAWGFGLGRLCLLAF